jgi:hypothetical protein
VVLVQTTYTLLVLDLLGMLVVVTERLLLTEVSLLSTTQEQLVLTILMLLALAVAVRHIATPQT